MILQPESFGELYSFLKYVVTLQERGYSILLDKSKMFVSSNMHFSDKRKELYPEFFEDIISLGRYNGEQSSLSTTLSSQVRTQMTDNLKKHGMAKIGSTTRFDLVVGETRKNTVFMLQNFSGLRNSLNRINQGLSVQEQALNAPVLEYLRVLAAHPIHSTGSFYGTTISSIGTVYRRISITTRGSNTALSDWFAYSSGKHKFAFNSFDIGGATRMTAFLDSVDLYINTKNESKDIYFTNTNNVRTRLYDILFMEATDVIDRYVPDNYNEPRQEIFQIII